MNIVLNLEEVKRTIMNWYTQCEDDDEASKLSCVISDANTLEEENGIYDLT